MNKNKIAGLVLAGAIISGAGTSATSAIIKAPTKTKNNTKNEVLLADQNVEMDSTAVVVNGDNSLVLKNDVNGSIISYLSVGEMLHVTAKDGNYYKVTIKETGATGFISAKNVQLIVNGEGANFVSLHGEGHVVNVSSEVHLRGKASLDSNIIGFLKNGANFKILGQEGQWYKIDANGHIGFIYEEYIAKDTKEVTEPIKIEKKATSKIETIPAKAHVTPALKENNNIVSAAREDKVKEVPITNKEKVEKTKVIEHEVSKAPEKVVKHESKETKKVIKKQEVKMTTGNAIITLINSSTEKPLANTYVSVDGKKLMTNSKGDLKLINLKEGNNTLDIQAMDYNNTTVTMNVEAGKTIDANVKLTSDNGTALLTFVNAEHLRSLKDLTISVNDNNYRTNNDGQVLLSDLNPGNHTLTIKAKGFNETTATIKIKADGQATGTIKLTPKMNIQAPVAIALNTNMQENKVKVENHKDNVVEPKKTTKTPVIKKETIIKTKEQIKEKSKPTKENNTIKNTHKSLEHLVVSKGTLSNNHNINNEDKNPNTINDNNTENNTRATKENKGRTVVEPKQHKDNVILNTNHEKNNNTRVNNVNNNNKQENNKVSRPQSNAALQEAIVKYAEQFLGRPYVWGATGPNAFDCSGLTSYVYRHFGYNIGRTTYQQIDQGVPVSLNDLQPGDLLFFGNPSAPDHVVIYIGNHQYIQAPQPGQSVDISSWDWNGIVAARRIV